MSQKKKITLSLNEETLDRLDQIAKEKYRSVDRTKAIRWMIDDCWEALMETPGGVKTICKVNL